jgi:hypothetical protein
LGGFVKDGGGMGRIGPIGALFRRDKVVDKVMDKVGEKGEKGENA